jgi:disulfide bond formation protein DsbB
MSQEKSFKVTGASGPRASLGLLYVAWVVALIATLGSLFFSEVMKLPPCSLCWYQRIFMYPLAIIIPLGILMRDPKAVAYGVGLSAPGLLLSIYHNLLYYHIIPESLAPCVKGISCTTRQIEWFGFLTIPLLSLLSFMLIFAAMVWQLRRPDGQ